MRRTPWLAALIITTALAGLLPSTADANPPPRMPPPAHMGHAPGFYTFPRIHPAPTVYSVPRLGYGYYTNPSIYYTPSYYYTPSLYVGPYSGFYYPPSYSGFYFYSGPGYYPSGANYLTAAAGMCASPRMVITRHGTWRSTSPPRCPSAVARGRCGRASPSRSGRTGARPPRGQSHPPAAPS